MKEIYLAGGCFWGTEHFFKQIEGVAETEVGFANGHSEHPTYQEVYTDQTGHAETVRVVYDEQVADLEFLLDMFFKAIDPTSLNRQGHDEGTRYRTGIYYADASQLPVIRQVMTRQQALYDQPLAVEVASLSCFYPAEEYHQDYLDKNPDGYCHLPLSLFAFARQARMRRASTLLALLAALLLAACGSRPAPGTTAAGDDSQALLDTLLLPAPDDSATVYGLACDGCTDTILVFLPLNNTASNPDTFNILEATRQRHIYGRPKVGDKVAVVRATTNDADSMTAQAVIDLDDLYGTWCYQVVPTLRPRADLTPKAQKQLLAQLPDSVRDSLLAPREYGLRIDADHTARTLGGQPYGEENSIAVYAPQKNYSQWQLLGARLLLTRTAVDSARQRHIAGQDTARLLLLRRDTLVLDFGDGEERGYYRKRGN